MENNKQQWLLNLEHEKKMLGNLKLWMKVLIILSSLGVGLAYWAMNLHNEKAYMITGWIGIVFAAICVVLCAVVGFAYKKGKNHFEKMLQLIQG